MTMLVPVKSLFIPLPSPSIGDTAAERIRVAGALLPMLESTPSPAERRRLFHRLTQASTPEAVVKIAFAEYDRTGREAFLLHAASLLEAFAEQAWPVLLWIARSGRPETELFLGLIARCPKVSDAQRSSAFRVLAKHPTPSVRLGLLEHLPGLGPDTERAILRDLAVSDPDPDVKTEAAGRLSVFVGSGD